MPYHTKCRQMKTKECRRCQTNPCPIAAEEQGQESVVTAVAAGVEVSCWTASLHAQHRMDIDGKGRARPKQFLIYMYEVDIARLGAVMHSIYLIHQAIKSSPSQGTAPVTPPTSSLVFPNLRNP